MPDDFVPLSVSLRRLPQSCDGATFAKGPPEPAAVAQPSAQLSVDARLAPSAGLERASCGGPASENVGSSVRGDLALMRLAVGEALEGAARRLLAEFADEVLGRELALAPSDSEALIRRAVAAFAELQPVRIFIAPDEAEHATLQTGRSATQPALPVCVDATLAPGDFVIEVRDGKLESQRSFRLGSLLERVNRSLLHAAPA